MATAVEFDVEYTETCPECSKTGQTVNLGFTMAEGIVCATGTHHFDRLPGDPQAPQTASSQAKPEPTVGISGLLPKNPKVHDPATGPSPEQVKQWKGEQLQEEMRERARKGEGQEPQPPVEAKPATVSNGKTIQVLDCTPAPAGEVTMTITLRERHASAVLAEASVQRQSMTEYFQEFLDRMLDAYWGLV